MTTTTKAARRRCNDDRAQIVRFPGTDSVYQSTWTRAKCRAIEIALGGGFAALALLEVIFQW